MASFIAHPIALGNRSFTPRVSAVSTFVPRLHSRCSRVRATVVATAVPLAPTEFNPYERDDKQKIVDPPIPTTTLPELCLGAWEVLQPIWTSHRRRSAVLWAFATIILTFSLTGYAVVLATAQKALWNCLAAKQISNFAALFAMYIGAVALGPALKTAFTWVKARLALVWRRVLSEYFLTRYLTNYNYYKLTVGTAAAAVIDNPDQRIGETITVFANNFINLMTNFAVAATDMIVFSIILHGIHAPLFYALAIYCAISSACLLYFGQPLHRIMRFQNRKEGDFRYNLIRLRDTSESIAFYQGSRPEELELRRRFHLVVDNTIRLLGIRRTVEYLSSSFTSLAQAIPIGIVAPQYFSGAVSLGIVTLANTAFTKVLHSLGIVAKEYQAITAVGAGIRRLKDLVERLDALDSQEEVMKIHAITHSIGDRGEMITRKTSALENRLALSNLTVVTPNAQRKVLVSELNFILSPAQSLLVSGPSGIGKTSLLRAICGLWSDGSGHVSTPPQDKCLFLPQKPLVMVGTLRENVAYPGRQFIADEVIVSALHQVNLAHLLDHPDRLDREGEELGRTLSAGEQQRLAFARVIVAKPDLLIMDECTSALDAGNEALMYDIIAQMHIAYVSVGNHTKLLDFHQRVLRIEDEGRWTVSSVDEIRAQQMQESRHW